MAPRRRYARTGPKFPAKLKAKGDTNRRNGANYKIRCNQEAISR
jgi:hypothetical protein